MDADGNPEIHYPGDYNVAVPGHRDIAYRQGVLVAEGVDTQVITLTTPGTHVETPARAVEYARLVNDAFATIISERSPRFSALATLPLNDPAASVVEFRRAMEQLRLPGAMLFSNVNGVALADKRYWPLYEAANELGAVLHIHPTNPISVEAMREYWLMPLVGFLFDTTVAAAHLVFSGVAERFPNIKWVLSHLGGAIPYLAERLDRGFHAFPECRAHVSREPSEISQDVVLRHRELRRERTRACGPVCWRRPHSRGQRLSTRHRKHSCNEDRTGQAQRVGNRSRKDPWGQCCQAVQAKYTLRATGRYTIAGCRRNMPW